MPLGRITMDLTPLRSSRDFRIMFWARIVALLGISLTLVALSVQAFLITRSSLAVGLVNVAAGSTLLAGSLVGGVLADRYDRRQLLLLSRTGAGVVFATLTVNALLDQPQMWVVYACAAVLGMVDGVSETALVAIVPDLVPAGQLAAAGALTAITTQVATMLGPSIAGAIIAGPGPGVGICFGITCAATVVQIALMSRVSRRPAAAAEHPHPLRAIVEGLQFVRRNRLIAGLLLIDVCGGLFALPYALFPEFGATVLDGDARMIGLMFSAPAVGAFLGALFSGWVARHRRPGWALLGAGLLWGLAITAFGVSGHLLVALVFLGIAGAAMIVSDILVRALLQQHTPSSLMGRVSSFWLALATVAPAAGGALLGGISGVTGPAVAVVLGGLGCVTAVVLIAAAIPELRRAVAPQTSVAGADAEVAVSAPSAAD